MGKSLFVVLAVVAVVFAAAGLAFRPASRPEPAVPPARKDGKPMNQHFDEAGNPVNTGHNRPLPVAPTPAEWTVTATGEGGCVATKAGVAGKSHYVTKISGSVLAGPAAGALLQLKDGDAAIWTEAIPSGSDMSAGINFERPVKIAAGHDVSAQVVIGLMVTYVNLAGYTR